MTLDDRVPSADGATAAPYESFYLPVRQAPRKFQHRWGRHILLLVITVVTTTVFGVDHYLSFSSNFGTRFVAMNRHVWLEGFLYSLSILGILGAHEMGHYIACRRYDVDATLPFFLPFPSLSGTLGAVIKIREAFPTRTALFDIGVAGPIAGFIALIPVAIIGVYKMQVLPAPAAVEPGNIVFADPLMMKLIGLAFGKDVALGNGNPFYFAAWMGLLVTALNLIPSGQLDGGHAIYAAAGAKIHAWTGPIAFVVMAVLSILGMLVYGSPAGFLIAVLLGVMMRVPHPQPWDDTPLDLKRKIVAVLTLVIFILCFNPFPIRLT